MTLFHVAVLPAAGIVQHVPLCITKGVVLPSGTLTVTRHFDRISTAALADEADRVFLCYLNRVELVASGAFFLLYLDMLQAINWLLLHFK